MYKFSELLKKIRETSGLTQEQMGRALDVSTVLITMIETGQKDASRKFIVKLADRLDVHPTSITPFMFNDDNSSRNTSKIEAALNNIGEKLQIFLITERAKKLKNMPKDTSRYPKIFINSKNYLAKRLANRHYTFNQILPDINDVIANFNGYWYDSQESDPIKNKYVRSAQGTKLGKLLKLIDTRILTIHDNILPTYIFGGISSKNHVQAARYFLENLFEFIDRFLR